jgi:hypothetical protein
MWFVQIETTSYADAIQFYADMNIQSPPSIYPPKRYCDLTGFEVCLLQYWFLLLGLLQWLY